MEILVQLGLIGLVGFVIFIYYKHTSDLELKLMSRNVAEYQALVDNYTEDIFMGEEEDETQVPIGGIEDIPDFTPEGEPLTE